MNKLLCGLLLISVAFIGIGAVAAANADHYGDVSSVSGGMDSCYSVCNSEFPYGDFPSAPKLPKGPGLEDPWGPYRPLHPENPHGPFNPVEPKLC